MSTKKADKATRKQSGEKSEKPTTGRVHTIAKARPTPVTGAPKEKPVAVIVGGDEPAASLTHPTAATAKAPKKPKRPATCATPPQPDDGQEVCVFAFRLLRSERDELHAATGSAKASKFVKAIVLAGARGDMKAIQEIVDEAQAGRK